MCVENRVMEIKLSENVLIDAQLIMTGRGCVIGQSGSGKSFLMSLIAEKLIAAGLPFCILDTEGEYLSFKDKFKNIIIIGGSRSDVGFDVNFKDLFLNSIKSSVPIILDVSDSIDKSADAYSALEALYKVEEQHRRPYLVMIEEADKFAPQIVHQKINIIEEIGVRGRKRGIGLLVATQRPSNISKNVLSQCSYGFIGKLTIDNDLNAISQLFSTRSALDEIVNLSTGEFKPFGIEQKDKFKVAASQISRVGSTPIVEFLQKGDTNMGAFIARLKGSLTDNTRQSGLIKPKAESASISAMRFNIAEEYAHDYAKKVSHKLFVLFGGATEKIDKIERVYINSALCTIRLPLGRKNEFNEQKILLCAGHNIVKINNHIEMHHLKISEAKLNGKDLTVLRLIADAGKIKAEEIESEISAKTKNESLKRLLAAGLIEAKGDRIQMVRLDKFFINSMPQIDKLKDKNITTIGEGLEKKEAEKVIQFIYPNAQLYEFFECKIPAYTITLRNKNKVREFQIDGIFGREILHFD